MENIKVFSWRPFPEWGPILPSLVPEIINSSLIYKIKSCANDIQYVDESGPLEDVITDGGDDDYGVEDFIRNFRKHYTLIQTYHGCRTENVNSYYKKGLLTLDSNHYNTIFRNLFCNERYPEVTNYDINKAINSVGAEYRHGELYVSLDDREFIEKSGHYLIYGSEYLMCLAVNLKPHKGKCYKDELRCYGKPTVFSIYLPVYFATDADLRCLFRHLLRRWIYNYAHNSSFTHTLDFSFRLRKKLPPECIITHSNPKYIRDWHNRGLCYAATTNSYCEWNEEEDGSC